jgi:periplasmic protein CpxP/Spy
MNRLLLSTSLALALSGIVVLAQQAETPVPAAKHYHAHSPQRETARLSKKLNLSPEQSAKIEPILADRDQKMTALKNDSTISPLIMQQKMKALHQQTRQQLATVFTPEQLQQVKSHRHNHGAPSQTQPLTPPNPQAGL